MGGGGGGKVRLRSLRYFSILLFIAGDPQKLDKQKYISLKSCFHTFFKNTTLREVRGMGKTLSLPEDTVMHYALII